MNGRTIDHEVSNKCPSGCCECCISFARIGLTIEEFDVLWDMGARLERLDGQLLLNVSGGCQFLNDCKCSIYGQRPSVCKRYVCDKIYH